MHRSFTLKLFFGCLFILFGTLSSIAQHKILSGEITYHSIASNTYIISTKLFVDCQGTALPDSIILDWSSSCQGGIAGSLPLSKAAGYPIDATQYAFSGGSYCNGGTGTRGIEHYLYLDTLVVPAACTVFDLSWSSCCHSDSFNSILSPNTTSFYLHSVLNNVNNMGYNSSPQFGNFPIIGACQNMPGQYYQGAYDYEGDTLRYSLVSCLANENDTVNYQAGYSGTAPLGASNPVSIDPQTGIIDYLISPLQMAMICVLVEEIRGGLVIGSVTREIMIVGSNCFNNTPVITGIDSTNNYDTTIVVGQTLCFDIHAEDLDTAQQLTMSLLGVPIPGATFTIDTTNNPIGTFCWTPTAADTGQHVFVIEVRDNGVPIYGADFKGFTINVVAVTSIPKIKKKEPTLSIAPNPAKEFIQVEFDQVLPQAIQLLIVDAQGKVVQQEHKKAGTQVLEIDIHSLHTGFYSIVTFDEAGEYISSQKLIIR
ncbi:T9SS type A sorting domain-containing protein [Aureispira anguillae]|uniref:T9SS type A sorting domain-containing protein n=1 Tax=Aureispira anguillae TaxID=2864201 RepID=A0A915YCX9_9BACT|nr:T9SS type A sorting domain-containing protein [Aureispira anguillae]BDS10784.1 T9SS type A sorting domain-containing protein [Aureispira anguillae]